MRRIIFFIIISIFISSCTISARADEQLDSQEIEYINLVNETRVERGLTALTVNIKLNNIAEQRCLDMVERNYFSHYTPEGRRVRYGEILAKATLYKTPSDILNAWLGSQSHKEVILYPIYKKIGIAKINHNNKQIIVILFSSK